MSNGKADVYGRSYDHVGNCATCGAPMWSPVGWRHDELPPPVLWSCTHFTDQRVKPVVPTVR